MRTFLLSFTILLLGVPGACTAQDTAAGVSARIVGKPLYLRGGWATDVLDFDANGSPKMTYEVAAPTLSGFEASSVELKGKNLVIEGQRFVVALGEESGPRRIPWHSKTYSGRMTLTIHGERHQDFGKALDAIFTPEMEKVAYPAAPPEPEAGDPPLRIGGEVTVPKTLYAADVVFPKAAMDLLYRPEVQVAMWVEPDGKPSHIHMVHPVGVGVDEAAIAAMRSYRFQPATLHGKPVRVELYMSVNVDIF